MCMDKVSLNSFIENIERELIGRIRNVLEIIIITTSIAYLGVYLISTLKLGVYLYFIFYTLYLVVGYEMRNLSKLHKSYLKLMRLTEREKLDRRRFMLVNYSLLAFNIVLALTILYKLVYLVPPMLILPLYLYYRIDERIISKEKVLIIALINVLFSVITAYDSSNFYVLTAIAVLIDLTVMKVG